MSCKKPNCCKKVQSEVTMKSTAQLQEEVTRDLEQDDKSLADILSKKEEEDDDEDKDDTQS